MLALAAVLLVSPLEASAQPAGGATVASPAAGTVERVPAQTSLGGNAAADESASHPSLWWTTGSVIAIAFVGMVLVRRRRGA